MPIKKSRPRPTRVPGILQDGPGRFLVRARWNDPRTGQRRKREGVATSFAAAVALQEQLKCSGAPRGSASRQRFNDCAEQ